MRGIPDHRLLLGIILVASLGVKPAFACVTDGDCDDADPCTTDTCAGGVCVYDFAPVDTPCGDPSDTDCDNPDTCSGNGVCRQNNEPNGITCDDGLSCNVNEACQGGFCTGGGPRDCNDANVCTTDTCDEIGDRCVQTPDPFGESCDDGDFCTSGDVCNVGYCVGDRAPGCCTSAAQCDDNNDCTDDECGVTDTCLHTPVATDTPCGSDGDTECTDPDTCDGSGTCLPNNAPDGTSCSGAEPCTAGQCSPTTYATAVLPENAFVGTIPYDAMCDGVSTTVIVGVGIDNLDVEHAAAWESDDGGETWAMVELDEGVADSSAAFGQAVLSGLDMFTVVGRRATSRPSGSASTEPGWVCSLPPCRSVSRPGVSRAMC